MEPNTELLDELRIGVLNQLAENIPDYCISPADMIDWSHLNTKEEQIPVVYFVILNESLTTVRSSHIKAEIKKAIPDYTKMFLTDYLDDCVKMTRADAVMLYYKYIQERIHTDFGDGVVNE